MGRECTQREFTDTGVVYILGGMEQDRGRPCQITQNYRATETLESIYFWSFPLSIL